MKSITQNLKISGIYCIINLKNGNRYIGSSKNIRQRLWSHRAELRHNKHENSHLQAAWNKYGEQNFDYYVIEVCDKDKLLEREQEYINIMKPEYNINQETQRPPCAECSRKKQSETRKRLYAEGKLKSSFKHITTYVYDLDGNFIKEYPSIEFDCLSVIVSLCLVLLFIFSNSYSSFSFPFGIYKFFSLIFSFIIGFSSFIFINLFCLSFNFILFFRFKSSIETI